MRRVAIAIVACVAAWVVATPVAAVDRSGVKPQVLSVPTGPGSIEGLGPAFTPEVSTGTAAYAVPLVVPPGVNGHAPTLELKYDSGRGNGHFGLGWDVPMVSIQRRTDKGQPRYQEGDVFVVGGGEELVPLRDGTWRCENEQEFRRFRIVGDGWEVTDRSGRIFRLGQTAGARVEFGGTGFDRTFRWYVESATDTNGNVMQYTYDGFAESPGELYLTEIRYNLQGAEFNSVRFEYEVRPDGLADYRSGFLVRTAHRGVGIQMRSRGQVVREYRLSYDPGNEVDDPRAAGAVELPVSLLSKVTVFDGAGNPDPAQCPPPLGMVSPGTAHCLPPLRFGYTRLHVRDRDNDPVGNFPSPEDIDLNGNGKVDDEAGVVPIANAPTSEVVVGVGSAEFLDVDADGLADLLSTRDGTHRYYRNEGHGQFGDAVAMGGAPSGLALDQSDALLADLDGDGRSDFVARPDLRVAWRMLRNRGDGTWADEVAVGGTPPFAVSDERARFVDLNADRVTDVIRSVSASAWQVCENTGQADIDYPPFENFPGPEDVNWNDDQTLDGPRFACAPDLMPVPFLAEGFSEVVFGDGAAVELADMNGDRLQDVVLLRVGSTSTRRRVFYWPGKGRSGFDAHVAIAAAGGLPDGELDLGESVLPGDGERLRVSDVTGDGLADLVLVSQRRVQVWINLGGTAWSAPIAYEGTPLYEPATTAIRIADVNGNGSPDVVYVGSAGWAYLDVAPLARPQQLALIDNGLGRRTFITYRSSVAFALDAAAASTPWRTTTPFPVSVVAQMATQPSLELDGETGVDEYVTDYVYRDAYYDAYEEEFRGFGWVAQVERGDADAPTKVTRFRFHTGAPDDKDNDGDGVTDERTARGGSEEESLKGKVMQQEVATDAAALDGTDAPDADLFTRTVSAWQVRELYKVGVGPVAEQPLEEEERVVAFAFDAQDDTAIVERTSGPPELLQVTRDYDAFGNVTAERNFGALSRVGDERFTFTDYAHDPDRWLIDRPCQRVITDGEGTSSREVPCQITVPAAHKVAETRSYYDGTPYEGRPLGEIGPAGNLMREEAWVDGTHYLNRVRNAYDAFGNVIGMLDPLGTPPPAPHSRQIDYDSTFHTFPTTETIHLGGPASPLVATASYDLGLGVMLTSTDFNANVTTYGHDSFGRLTSIVRPCYSDPARGQLCDSDALPTALYEYAMADPHRGIRLEYDPRGALTVSHSGATASRVTTHAREETGKPGTFDTVHYVDGLGRKLARVEEGETGFIVSEAVRFNTRGTVRDTLQPYPADTSAYVPPFFGVACSLTDTFPPCETTTRVDATGREVERVNPPPKDKDGRLTAVHTVYRPLQRTVRDELGNAMTYVSDGLDKAEGKGETRLVAVQEVNRKGVDPGTYLTRYTYNSADSLVQILDASGNTTSFAYDGLQRKVSLNHPDRGVVQYVYDDANLIETIDSKDQHIKYKYDGVNRLLEEDYKDDRVPGSPELIPDVRYVYDAPPGAVDPGDGTPATSAAQTRGRLTAVVDLTGEEHTSYDARGRIEWIVKRVRDPVTQVLASYKTAMTYDSLDRVRTLTYPDRDQIAYQYNNRRLLEHIVGGPSPSGNIITGIDYRPSGQLAQCAYGNDVVTDYAYDPRLRLVGLTTAPRAAPASTLLAYTYAFDGASNISAIEDRRPAGDLPRNTQVFAYDDLYRLTCVRYADSPADQCESDAPQSIRYAYDRLGNMLSQTSDIPHIEQGLSVTNLGAMSYGGPAGRANRQGRAPGDPPGPHALTRATADSAVRTYSYDDNGNMTMLDGKTLAWDFKDRLVAVEDAAMRAEYAYDYTDRRILRRVIPKANAAGGLAPPASTTVYVDRYFELRDRDEPVKYVFNGDIRVASIRGNLTATTARVQRFSVAMGWNLVTLVVDAPNPLVQLDLGPGHLITEAWVPEGASYRSVDRDEQLSPGTVVWLKAREAARLQIVGVPVEAQPVKVPAGGGFVGVAGFQSLSLAAALPPSVSAAWLYDATATRWRGHFLGTTAAFSDTPAFVAPGEALFVIVPSAITLALPSAADRVHYYHQDHLGSSDVVTDSNGARVEGATFYPFGHQRLRMQKPTAPEEPYSFADKEREAGTGLYYLGARYLMAVSGRFVTVDPLSAKPATRGSLNPYAYSRSNPLNYVDRDGMAEVSVHINRVGDQLRYTVTKKEGGQTSVYTFIGYNAPKGGVPPLNPDPYGADRAIPPGSYLATNYVTNKFPDNPRYTSTSMPVPYKTSGGTALSPEGKYRTLLRGHEGCKASASNGCPTVCGWTNKQKGTVGSENVATSQGAPVTKDPQTYLEILKSDPRYYGDPEAGEGVPVTIEENKDAPATKFMLPASRQYDGPQA